MGYRDRTISYTIGSLSIVSVDGTRLILYTLLMKKARAKGKAAPESRRPRISLSVRASALILVGITIMLLLPFAGKAFNMDDPLFIWSAKHIQSHFADPYGFDVNWYGKLQPMWKVTKNPPLASYYIALWAFVVGWSELALHLAFLIPAIACTLGIYFLAAKFCSRPFEAALAAILTPVFLLSGTMVMCDVLMLTFWVWAAYLWIRGTEENRHGLLALSMVLVTLSALTKYFGIALIPLLAAYSIASKKRPLWAIHLLIPIVVLAAYQFATKSLYGHGLLSDAGQYGAWYRSQASTGGLPKFMTGLAFTGGCILTALFCAPLLWKRAGLIIGLVIAGLAYGVFMPLRLFHEAEGCATLQLALLFTAGTGVLTLAVQDFIKRRDALSLTLLLWIIGTFIFASVLNWSVNGRSILPMAPAAGILIMRQIEKRKNISWHIYIPLALAALASVLIASADYQLAGSARKAANQIAESYGSEGRDIWLRRSLGVPVLHGVEGRQAYRLQEFQPEERRHSRHPVEQHKCARRRPGCAAARGVARRLASEAGDDGERGRRGLLLGHLGAASVQNWPRAHRILRRLRSSLVR